MSEIRSIALQFSRVVLFHKNELLWALCRHNVEYCLRHNTTMFNERYKQGEDLGWKTYISAFYPAAVCTFTTFYRSSLRQDSAVLIKSVLMENIPLISRRKNYIVKIPLANRLHRTTINHIICSIWRFCLLIDPGSVTKVLH